MRIFYSELAEYPAYCSYGYSIYAELAEGESAEAAYEKGFLPCIVAREQPERLMYQARGVRLLVQEFVPRTDHRRVIRRMEEGGAKPVSTLRAFKDFSGDEEFLKFLLRYFAFRFGKESMPEERVRAILASPWITHVREFRIGGKVASYILESHTDSSIHIWYQAYAKEYENTNLGIYAYLVLMEVAKAAGKQYAYFGVSFGRWMRYKAGFAPLEYWDGASWVRDEDGKKLKALLDEGVRPIAYVDRWRSAQEPFYPEPSFPGLSKEGRLLQTLLDGAPRLTLLILLLPVLLVLYVFLRSLG